MAFPVTALGPSKETTYSRPGSDTGKGRRSRASINRKAEVQAPIPSASDRMAAAEATLFFMS